MSQETKIEQALLQAQMNSISDALRRFDRYVVPGLKKSFTDIIKQLREKIVSQANKSLLYKKSGFIDNFETLNVTIIAEWTQILLNHLNSVDLNKNSKSAFS